MSKLTRSKAEAALEAVKTMWATDLAPMTVEGKTYAPTYAPPTLIEDYDGEGWAIAWEEGPSEWTYLVNSGGTSEEDAALFADAAAEFGVTLTAPVKAPAKMPTGVYAEPVNHVVLGLYPA